MPQMQAPRMVADQKKISVNPRLEIRFVRVPKKWHADAADASNADDRGSEKDQRKSALGNPLNPRSIKELHADAADASTAD